MASLYNCWTCNKSLLSEEVTEEYFFWCNKDCHDKDEQYKYKSKIIDTKLDVAVIDKKTEQEQRKAKIRAAISEIKKSKEGKG